MLDKKHRLRKRSDIQKVFKEGRASKEGLLILKKRLNGLACSRFCVIVSRKVSKKASVRNGIRRGIAEVIRLNLPEIKEGFDMVLLVSPGLGSKKPKEIKENVKKILFSHN